MLCIDNVFYKAFEHYIFSGVVRLGARELGAPIHEHDSYSYRYHNCTSCHDHAIRDNSCSHDHAIRDNDSWQLFGVDQRLEFVCENNWLHDEELVLIDFTRLWFPYCDPSLPREAVSPEEAEGAVAEATWLPSSLQSLVLQSNPVQNVGAVLWKVSAKKYSQRKQIMRWRGSGEHMDFRQLCKAQRKLWKRWILERQGLGLMVLWFLYWEGICYASMNIWTV